MIYMWNLKNDTNKLIYKTKTKKKKKERHPVFMDRKMLILSHLQIECNPWDLPSGSVIKTLLPLQGCGLDPRSGN